VASKLPALAVKLSRRASCTDRIQRSFPEELRPGFALLVEALQLSGPDLEEVADAADDVVSERVLFGTGVALIATRAAALPKESRLLFAQLMCETCPQLVSPFVPSYILAPFCTSGSGSKEAWQAREAAKAAYREQRREVKASYKQAAAATKAAHRRSAEEHRDAMQRLSRAHAQSCREAARAHREAHREACRAQADRHRAAAAEAAEAAAARAFAWWR